MGGHSDDYEYFAVLSLGWKVTRPLIYRFHGDQVSTAWPSEEEKHLEVQDLNYSENLLTKVKFRNYRFDMLGGDFEWWSQKENETRGLLKHEKVKKNCITENVVDAVVRRAKCLEMEIGTWEWRKNVEGKLYRKDACESEQARSSEKRDQSRNQKRINHVKNHEAKPRNILSHTKK